MGEKFLKVRKRIMKLGRRQRGREADGPLFPRLHIKDAEKGEPKAKAPPRKLRNKICTGIQCSFS